MTTVRFLLAAALVAVASLALALAQRVDERVLVYWLRMVLAELAQGLDEAPPVMVVVRRDCERKTTIH